MQFPVVDSEKIIGDYLDKLIEQGLNINNDTKQRMVWDLKGELRSAQDKIDRTVTRRTDYSVVICENCKGEGETRSDVCTDYHRRDYSLFFRKCRECDGTGRLYKKIITECIAYIPEVHDENKAY